MKRGKPIIPQPDGYGLLNHPSRVEMILSVVLFSDAMSQVPFILGLLLYFDRSLYFTKCCDITMGLTWSAFSSSFHIRALDHKRHFSELPTLWLVFSCTLLHWTGMTIVARWPTCLSWPWQTIRLLILFSKGPGVWHSHSACIVTYPSCPFLQQDLKLSRSLHLTAWQC